MGTPLRVLIVEDSEDDALLEVRELKRGGYDPVWERVDTHEAMMAALEKGGWNLVICDYSMPRFDALAALMLLKETGLDLPFLVVSGTIGEDVAVETMRAGAHDYFMKGELARLAPAVKRELWEAEGRRARQEAEKKLRASAARWQSTFDAIGDSVCLLDEEQTVLACNQAMAGLVGKSLEQIVGRKCWEVVHDSQEPLEGCPVLRMRRTLRRENMLLPVGDRWLDVTVDPFLDERGRMAGAVHIISDIAEQRQSEAALRRSERVESVLNRIANAFLTLHDDEMYGEVLAVVLEAVESRHGVFGYIDENGALVCPSLTRDIWDQCNVPDKKIVYPQEVWGDAIWARALREKKTFCSNEPSTKVPEGHIPVRRNVATPVVFQGEAVGLLHVANKETEYEEKDVEILELIAQQIGPVLSARLQEQRTEQKRKAAEEALRESERHATLMLDSVNTGIMVIDAATRNVEFANPTALEMVGRSLEEVVGRQCHGFICPSEECCCPILDLGQEIDRSERVLLTKSGEKIPILKSAVSLERDGRKLVIESFVDVSDRKRAEEDLRNKTHDLGERVKELQCLYAVSDLLQEPGTSLDDVLQAVADVILPGWQYPEITCARIKLGSRVYVTENFSETDWVLGCDIHVQEERMGRLEVFYLREMPTLDEGPFAKEERALIIGLAEQIGRFMEQRRAEEAVKDSEEMYRTLVHALPDAVTMSDLQGRVTYASPQTVKLHGFADAEEAQGTLAFDMIAPEERQRALANAERTLEEGLSGELEYTLLRKDGTPFPGQLTAALVKDAHGAPTGFIAITRDLTQKKMAEEALSKTQDQLVQAQKMEAVGRLAGGVAHDFNNLLAAVIGFSELGMARLSEEDPIYEDLKQIRDVGNRAAVLVRQLLAFSRRQVLAPKVLDLNTVVKEMDSMLRRVIGEDIDIATVLHPKLRRAKVDPGQLEQVIMNLAVNARDAMPLGGKLTIETENVDLDEEFVKKHMGSRPGPHVMLAVTDSGCGMDDETRSRVFEPFYTTKEAGKGTGLGLSTVYGIVKQSGGSIYVYSEPGKGTTFKVYLPRTERPETREVPRVVTGPLRGTETVLVVEDEEVVRRLVCRILRSRGYRVLEAANGGEALLICEKHEGPIPLLLSDVVLPGMSGRKLAERLAELRPEMRVLFMSGYTDSSIVHHGVLDETTPFIQKPFTPDGLALKVREVLEGYGDPQD